MILRSLCDLVAFIAPGNKAQPLGYDHFHVGDIARVTERFENLPKVSAALELHRDQAFGKPGRRFGIPDQIVQLDNLGRLDVSQIGKRHPSGGLNFRHPVLNLSVVKGAQGFPDHRSSFELIPLIMRRIVAFQIVSRPHV